MHYSTIPDNHPVLGIAYPHKEFSATPFYKRTPCPWFRDWLRPQGSTVRLRDTHTSATTSIPPGHRTCSNFQFSRAAPRGANSHYLLYQWRVMIKWNYLIHPSMYQCMEGLSPNYMSVHWDTMFDLVLQKLSSVLNFQHKSLSKESAFFKVRCTLASTKLLSSGTNPGSITTLLW